MLKYVFLLKVFLSLILNCFLIFQTYSQTERRPSKCEFLDIECWLNGTVIQNEYKYQKLKKGATLIIKFEEAESDCAYRFGKITIYGLGGRQNEIIETNLANEFSERKESVRITLNSKLYQKLKHEKRCDRLIVRVDEVWQKDENGNITQWKRWHGEEYYFNLE